VEDPRERKLLDRIEQRVKRVEAREHPGSAIILSMAVRQASAAGSMLVAPSPAQQITPATTPEAALPPSLGSSGFRGMVDVNGSYIANHSASQRNLPCNFLVKSNQFGLNMTKLSKAQAQVPAVFQLVSAIDCTSRTIHAAELGVPGFRVQTVTELYLESSLRYCVALDFNEGGKAQWEPIPLRHWQ
jgi:hypothetical protein